MGVVKTIPSTPTLVSNSVTISANNTTASVVCFTVTGSVLVTKLYGIVTTALSSNHTAAHWRLNDQTATPAITLATGTTLSSAAAGTMIAKNGQVDVALVNNTNAAGVVGEPAVDNENYFNPFIAVKKTGATTTIDYRYTTTDAPATGVIKMFAEYIPLSDDGALT